MSHIYKRIVVKIGTSILAPEARFDEQRIKPLVKQVAKLIKQGKDIIIVTSGAIGAGMSQLGLSVRPQNLPQQQACASVGQSSLMHAYELCFKPHKIMIGQILLTGQDMANSCRYLNARNTFFTLLKLNVTPIVNENDTVSVDEIRFGDNDTLSALVANLVDADLLVILSDVDGLYDQNTKETIPVVETITADIEAQARDTDKETSTGGMISKLKAAKIANPSGIPVVIANGTKPNILLEIVENKRVGTYFKPCPVKLTHRKRWLAFTAKSKGTLVVDKGAVKALVKDKRSLLASGIIESIGSFKIGDLVSVADEYKNEFAKGLVNYSAQELAKIKGLNSNMIESALGYRNYDEVIHRDNLAIL